jgi:phage-related protein
MSSSIYGISAWAGSTNYRKNDIIINGNYYYYSALSHLSSSDFSADYNASKWNGIGQDGAETKPYFVWVPSYNSPNTNQPRVKTIQFSDGYALNMKDGINNILLNLDINFENRNLDEATAIIHFLSIRAGAESFLFSPPPPYQSIKRFLCKEFSDRQVFYDNYSIQCKFTEVVV